MDMCIESNPLVEKAPVTMQFARKVLHSFEHHCLVMSRTTGSLQETPSVLCTLLP